MNATRWQRTLQISLKAATCAARGKLYDGSTVPVPPSGETLKNTFFLWGPPGIFKSQATEHAFDGMTCPACGKHPVPVVVKFLSQILPEDIRGVLIFNPAKDVATWHHNPDWRIGTECPVCYFLDEFNQADRAVQKAALEFTNRFSISGESLPKGSVMVLAGNRPEDGADVEELVRPQRTRVDHIEAEFDFEVWKDWAWKAKIHPYVISFLNAKPTYCYKPDTGAARGEPLPRTWHRTSDVLYTYPEDLWDELVTGWIGEGMATEFLGWTATAGKLMPLVERVLAGENVAADELSAQFFIGSSLVDRLIKDKKIADRICTYAIWSADRAPEAAAVMVKDAARVDEKAMTRAANWKRAVERLADYVV